MKKRFVNLERTDENVADQYPDIFDGLQKDAVQNAWDARWPKGGEHKHWKILFKYLPSYNALVIEDFGTTGMNEDKWGRYQGLWHTDKVENEDTAGSRGQGKFLFHYFSKDKMILTETIDEKNNYRFSHGTNQEYDDENKTLSEFIPEVSRLNHQGSKIWILNVKDELKKGLLNVEQFLEIVAASWWEIIQNYSATIIVDFDGNERKVTLPSFFDAKIKKERHYQNEDISKVGKVRNLVLRCLLKEEIPSRFQGIAVQRAGMTILHLPIRADESIKNKIFGYCNFDKSLESELKKCELPNHMGFTVRRAWTHAREFVEHKLESFVLELNPKKEKIIADQRILDEAVRLINKLVYELIPELSESKSPFGGNSPTPTSPIPPKSKPSIYIEQFSPSARKIEYGATLITHCGVVNEGQIGENLSLFVKIFREQGGNKKYSEKFDFELSTATRKTFDIPPLDFDENKDQSGKYIGEATLKSGRSTEVLDTRRFIFYVNTEPPTGKSFISKFTLGPGRGLFFERWRNLPRNEKGIVHIVWDHPEFVRLREQAKNRSKKAEGKEIMFYCTKCGADEAMRRLLEVRYNEKKITSDELKEIKKIHDELIYNVNVSIF